MYIAAYECIIYYMYIDWHALKNKKALHIRTYIDMKVTKSHALFVLAFVM